MGPERINPGDVIDVYGAGKWRVVWVSGDTIEAIAWPWAAAWAAPRAFTRSQVVVEASRHDLRAILERAQAGVLDYVYSRNATHLGHARYWDLQYVGEEPCEPYVAHGNFNVYSHGISRSYLTPKGYALLEALRVREARSRSC